ncbi:hypothetical protein [Georgenia alba]|uniref:Leucine rich repeat variant domain-containing protein n=1 Tax=Georgenia alba TaxID=2233858 RepID=A0ABW2Q222_9MICO
MTSRDDGAHGGGLEAQAADPGTPLATLHQLAQHHPELRATIAENPSTYPALLEWLGKLGMPEVDAALARRAAAEQAVVPPPPPPEADAPQQSADGVENGETVARPTTAQPDETVAVPVGPAVAMPPAQTDESTIRTADRADEDRPVERRSILGRGTNAGAAGAAAAGAGAWAAQGPAHQPTQPQPVQPTQPQPVQPTQPQPVQPTQQPTQQQPTQPAWHQPQAAHGAAAGGAGGVFASSGEDDARRRSWVPLAILAGVAAVLVVIVILQFTGAFSGGDEEPERPPTAEQTTTEQQTEEPTDATSETADVEAARDQLAGLPDETSCEDPAGDAGVFAAFASASAPDGAWADEGDPALVGETLQGLQDSCDSAYAVTLVRVLTDGETTPEALSQAVEDAGTDWVDMAEPAPDGASEVSAFQSPSGNIQCELGDDGVRCTIIEHDFDAPEGCDDGTTLQVQIDGNFGSDCGNPVGEQSDVLEYGDSAVSGWFACTSEMDGMTCWNTLDGTGFSVARAGYEEN